LLTIAVDTHTCTITSLNDHRDSLVLPYNCWIMYSV